MLKTIFETFQKFWILKDSFIWFELLHPRFSLKKRVWKYFISKTSKVESGFRFENPLCFEQKKCFRLLFKVLFKKQFENDSKMFLNGLFGKDRLKNQFQFSYFKFYWKGVQNALKIFYKSSKSLVQSLQPFAFGKWAVLVLNLNYVWFQNKIWKEMVWLVSKVYF